MNSRLLLNKGFTLLEVLIAMTILIFIGISIFQATTQTYRIRDELVNEGDFFNAIRLSMGIIERDLSLVYTPTMMLPKPKPSPAQGQNGPRNFPGIPADNSTAALALQNNSDYWGASTHKTGLRPSRFIGKEDQFWFIGCSKRRVYRDSKESEFVKIKYELKTDPHPSTDSNAGHSILVKSESIDVFSMEDTIDKSIRTYPLLPGVSKLKFRYYRKDKKDYVSSWDSDSADLKNTYPDMIEIEMEVKATARLIFEGLFHFRPEIPMAGTISASY